MLWSGPYIEPSLPGQDLVDKKVGLFYKIISTGTEWDIGGGRDQRVTHPNICISKMARKVLHSFYTWFPLVSEYFSTFESGLIGPFPKLLIFENGKNDHLWSNPQFLKWWGEWRSFFKILDLSSRQQSPYRVWFWAPNSGKSEHKMATSPKNSMC